MRARIRSSGIGLGGPSSAASEVWRGWPMPNHCCPIRNCRPAILSAPSHHDRLDRSFSPVLNHLPPFGNSTGGFLRAGISAGSPDPPIRRYTRGAGAMISELAVRIVTDPWLAGGRRPASAASLLNRCGPDRVVAAHMRPHLPRAGRLIAGERPRRWRALPRGGDTGGLQTRASISSLPHSLRQGHRIQHAATGIARLPERFPIAVAR